MPATFRFFSLLFSVFFSAQIIFQGVILADETDPAVVALSEEQILATGDSDLIFQEGMKYKEQGHYPDAERFFRKAIEINSFKAEYHFELANVYAAFFDQIRDHKTNIKTDDILSGARRELEQVVMLDSKHLPAYYNLGVVYKRQGEYEKARDSFRKVLEMDPQQVSAQMQIGSVYEAQGFFDEAEDSYMKAREMGLSPADHKLALQDLRQKQYQLKTQDNIRNYSGGGFGSLTDRGGYGRMPFGYSPNSQAAALAEQQGMGGQPSGGAGGMVMQAAPVLGSWLLGEFMKRRQNNQQANN